MARASNIPSYDPCTNMQPDPIWGSQIEIACFGFFGGMLLEDQLPSRIVYLTKYPYVLPLRLQSQWTIVEAIRMIFSDIGQYIPTPAWMQASNIAAGAEWVKVTIQRKNAPANTGCGGAPTISFTYDPGSIDLGDSVRFIPSGTNLTENSRFVWEFVDASGAVKMTSEEKSPVIKVDASTPRYLRVTVVNECGSARYPSSGQTALNITSSGTSQPPDYVPPSNVQPTGVGKGEIVSITPSVGLVKVSQGTLVSAVVKNTGTEAIQQGTLRTVFGADGIKIGEVSVGNNMPVGSEVVATIPVQMGTMGQYSISAQTVGTTSVQSSNRGAATVGVWTEEAALSPPWWETLLAKPEYLIAGVAAVGGLIAIAVGLRRSPPEY